MAYDPAFAYELAVIVRDGMRRMYEEMKSVFYYMTSMNENYRQPAMPPGVEQGVLKGMYLLQIGGKGKVRVQLLGAGTILREVIAAAEILEQDFSIPADVWSVTSFSELRREGLSTDRWNRLHPEETQRKTYVSECLGDREGPVIAASDYMQTVADQIRPWVPAAMLCWARTATAAVTPAPRCASISRSIAITSL